VSKKNAAILFIAIALGVSVYLMYTNMRSPAIPGANDEFTARCYKCEKEWPVTKATLVKDGVPDLGPAGGWLIKCPTCADFSPVRKPGTPFPTTMPGSTFK